MDLRCDYGNWFFNMKSINGSTDFSFLTHSLVRLPLLFSYLLVKSSYLLLYFWCGRAKCTPFKLITLFVNSMSQFNEIVLVVVIESIAASVFAASMPLCLPKLFFWWNQKSILVFRWIRRLSPLSLVCVWMFCWARWVVFTWADDDSNVFFLLINSCTTFESDIGRFIFIAPMRNTWNSSLNVRHSFSKTNPKKNTPEKNLIQVYEFNFNFCECVLFCSSPSFDLQF